jgi:hypothetical protein
MNEQIKKEPQSQQGIIENWREGWRDYAHGDFVDPESFIEFVLKRQLEKTRKETLGEVVSTFMLSPIWDSYEGKLYVSWKKVFDKLQSLIN